MQPPTVFKDKKKIEIYEKTMNSYFEKVLKWNWNKKLRKSLFTIKERNFIISFFPSLFVEAALKSLQCYNSNTQGKSKNRRELKMKFPDRPLNCRVTGHLH